MSKSRQPDKKISFHTERKAGEYLFDKGGEEITDSQFLDMRTRIKSEDTMKALVFYGILGEQLECEAARDIQDMMERMLIARNGEGRWEAVQILKQNFPRIREVDKGHDKDLDAPETGRERH